MSAEPHIAVIDDEAEIRELFSDYLTAKGYRVTCAESAAEFKALLDSDTFDVALLDVNMPGEDGFSLARHIRSTSDMGVIMVTAATDVFDRVVGLEIGADDYLTKPFALEEVEARVQSVLRRMARESGREFGADSKLTSIGPFIVDLETRAVSTHDGSPPDLSKTEMDILVAFATHPNEVLSRDQLLNLAGGGRDDAFDRSIDVRIARIRRKVEADPAKPQVIKTIRGAGYKYVSVAVS